MCINILLSNLSGPGGGGGGGGGGGAGCILRTARRGKNIPPRFSTGALDGGVSRFHMSILRNVYVALSNLRNGHVTLSNLRNGHVPCHYLFKPHVACH